MEMITKPLKIRKNVPLSKNERPRTRWVFNKMEVGDVIDVKEKSAWPTARKYAHNFASKKGWKITAKWIDGKKLGRIRRVS